MLLAAGLGTRLRPLTDHTPKALIDVGGLPIIERVARRLIEAGADRLIVNLHHLGERLRSFMESRRVDWGVEVAYSDEAGGALETGGGVLHAASLIRRDAPFFLHNADILTDLPLRAMYAVQLQESPLATLAVMERESTRSLLFDDRGLLGRVDEAKGIRIEVREAEGEVRRLAFAGVHVVDPAFLEKVTERGVFSILDPYLRLAGTGERIFPFRIEGSHWLDIGKPAQLEEARRSVDQSSR